MDPAHKESAENIAGQLNIDSGAVHPQNPVHDESFKKVGAEPGASEYEATGVVGDSLQAAGEGLGVVGSFVGDAKKAVGGGEENIVAREGNKTFLEILKRKLRRSHPEDELKEAV